MASMVGPLPLVSGGSHCLRARRERRSFDVPALANAINPPVVVGNEEKWTHSVPSASTANDMVARPGSRAPTKVPRGGRFP